MPGAGAARYTRFTHEQDHAPERRQQHRDDRLRPGLPGRHLRSRLERQARDRRAPRQAHGNLGAGGDGIDPAPVAWWLRQGRPRQSAHPHAEGARDRRGHGPTPPTARALAHGFPRAELDGRARRSASPRARAVPASRRAAGRDAGHAQHVPARQSHSRHGQAAQGGAVPARPGEGGRHRRGGAHHRGSRGRQEAPRAPLAQRRAARATAHDRRGGAVGRHHHRRQQRPADRTWPARRRKDLGVYRVKAVVLALLFIAFFYGFYCGVMAIWSYFAMASIVDDAVTERGRAAAAPVRDYIIKSAAESGVRIQDRNVVVTTDERQLNINLRWTFPVGTYKGEDIVEIPLSMERAFGR